MSRTPVFELIRDLYLINISFKPEDKIQNTSKVIAFTWNHRDDDDDDDGTKNNIPPPRGGGGGLDIIPIPLNSP